MIRMFIQQNVILVAGAAVLCFSLLISCAAFLFMGALKIKHNRLRKRLRESRGTKAKHKSRGKPGGDVGCTSKS